MAYMEQQGRLIAKGIFVATCCTGASNFVDICSRVRYTEHADVDRTLGIVGSVSLFAVLAVALWLGSREKLSASWLTLGYGSWLTILVMGYLGNLWITPSYFWAAITFVVSVPLVWGGLRAALGGRWSAVLCWCLGSSISILCLSLWSAFG